MRFAVVILFTWWCAGAIHGQEAVSKKGAIVGRVTLSNKAMGGITVTVSKRRDALTGAVLITQTTTDDEGRFRVSNLPGGTYYLQPFVPAYVVSETGQEVTLENEDAVENINFSLVRGAVITGKVSDSSGRPIVDESVSIRPTDRSLDRLVGSIYPNVNEIRTDDRGIYRAYGLPPGKYKVSVGQQFGAYNSTKGRRVYSQTFHPDVTDEAKALVVELSQGTETTNVNITVARPLAGFLASGRFTDAENGQPVPNVNFGLNILKTGVPSGAVSGTGVSSKDGEFRIDNLPPGQYIISVVSSSGNGYYGESEAFEIIDGDVTDLDARIHRGATIAGKVVFEGSYESAIQQELARARLDVLVRGEGNSRNAASNTNINPDGSFVIGPVQAGTALISLGSVDKATPVRLRMLSIDLNGTDQSRGVRVTTGEDISGVRIVVGSGTGGISGSVRLETGALSPEVTVSTALVRSGATFVVARASVDARGHFSFSRIPPGSYEVIVQAFSGSGALPVVRKAVAVSDGVVSEVSITLSRM